MNLHCTVAKFMLNEKLNLIEGKKFPKGMIKKYVLGSIRMLRHEQFHET